MKMPLKRRDGRGMCNFRRRSIIQIGQHHGIIFTNPHSKEILKNANDMKKFYVKLKSISELVNESKIQKMFQGNS